MAHTRHFGVLIPSTNTTAEIEYTRLLPETLQFHIGRCGKGGASPFSPSLDSDVIRQSKMLGDAKVEVITLLQTSASLFEDGYDARIKALMSENAGAPALTSAEAIGEAVQALGARRIAIVTPYAPQVLDSAKRYYESRYGLQVVAMEGFGATDAYAIGKLDADMAFQALRRVDTPNIEVLLVPGGNFPTMPWIEKWEQALGKPVITTNQAVVWGAKRIMKVSDPLPGLGRLLAKPC
jgi:maleate cis-trans isomerase